VIRLTKAQTPLRVSALVVLITSATCQDVVKLLYVSWYNKF